MSDMNGEHPVSNNPTPSISPWEVFFDNNITPQASRPQPLPSTFYETTQEVLYAHNPEDSTAYFSSYDASTLIGVEEQTSRSGNSGEEDEPTWEHREFVLPEQGNENTGRSCSRVTWYRRASPEWVHQNLPEYENALVAADLHLCVPEQATLISHLIAIGIDQRVAVDVAHESSLASCLTSFRNSHPSISSPESSSSSLAASSFEVLTPETQSSTAPQSPPSSTPAITAPQDMSDVVDAQTVSVDDFSELITFTGHDMADNIADIDDEYPPGVLEFPDFPIMMTRDMPEPGYSSAFIAEELRFLGVAAASPQTVSGEELRTWVFPDPDLSHENEAEVGNSEGTHTLRRLRRVPDHLRRRGESNAPVRNRNTIAPEIDIAVGTVEDIVQGLSNSSTHNAAPTLFPAVASYSPHSTAVIGSRNTLLPAGGHGDTDAEMEEQMHLHEHSDYHDFSFMGTTPTSIMTIRAHREAAIETLEAGYLGVRARQTGSSLEAEQLISSLVTSNALSDSSTVRALEANAVARLRERNRRWVTSEEIMTPTEVRARSTMLRLQAFTGRSMGLLDEIDDIYGHELGAVIWRCWLTGHSWVPGHVGQTSERIRIMRGMLGMRLRRPFPEQSGGRSTG